MGIARRRLLSLAGAALAASSLSTYAWSQSYPTRPVRVMVGWPAGGAADAVARLIGQRLSERLRQPFVIENRVGANTNIATEMVLRAPPDGYTLLHATGANAINASFYAKLNFDFIADSAPIASIVDSPFVMMVHPSFPAKTVPEFITHAKANPGKINMASAGTGSPNQLAGEMFKMMAGVDMLHVPYRGDPAAAMDLIGGQVQVYFGTLGGVIEHIKDGKLRALAVTTTKRLPVLAEIPAMAAFLPGYEVISWMGLVAPKNTPGHIVEALNKEVIAALADTSLKAKLEGLGLGVLPGSPSEFRELIAADTAKWTKVVKFAGIKSN